VTDFLAATAIVIVTVGLMEGFAYVVHKYVMHGFLWSLHEDHHRPTEGVFEKNDWFGVIFSVPALFLFTISHFTWFGFFWVALGITIYGMIYFGFHDVIVHRRIRSPIKPNRGYLGRITRAHRMHHAVNTKDGCVSYGFLWAPPLDDLRRQLRDRRLDEAAIKRSEEVVVYPPAAE
jgi:beta-carotene 3-hydroxylase